jgi:hypothetical protein
MLQVPTYSSPIKVSMYTTCVYLLFYSFTNTASRNTAMFAFVWHSSLATHRISFWDVYIKLQFYLKWIYENTIIHHAAHIWYYHRMFRPGTKLSMSGEVPDFCKHGWVSWSHVGDRIKRRDITYMDTFMGKWGSR